LPHPTLPPSKTHLKATPCHRCTDEPLKSIAQVHHLATLSRPRHEELAPREGTKSQSPPPSPLPLRAPPRRWTPLTILGSPRPQPELCTARESSLTTPTPPTTTTLACRPSYTIADPLHRGQTLLVSPLPSATPNLVHRLAGLLPEASSTHLAVSNRQIPASRHRLARLMPFPYFSSSGQKCRVGQATLLAGWAVSLLVQPTATVVFLFYTFD
jgi:hypothetical protein